ncbi:TPA: hypothetical protein ACU2YM_002646 [Staphylococcus aureus]
MSEEIKEEKRKYGFYHRKGEKIKVVFTDGKAITGKYLFASSYEIFMEKPSLESIYLLHHMKFL